MRSHISMIVTIYFDYGRVISIVLMVHAASWKVIDVLFFVRLVTHKLISVGPGGTSLIVDHITGLIILVASIPYVPMS